MNSPSAIRQKNGDRRMGSLFSCPHSPVYFLILLLTGLLSAQASELRVKGQADTINLSHAGKSAKLKLPEEVGVDMDDAILLADQVRAEHRYLLLQVTGPSRRSGNGNGNCGGGVETSIVWLKLTNWRIAELKHRKVESCWTDEGFVETPKWKNAICKVVFWAPRENNQEFTLTYDSAKPEKGFQLTSKPFN